MVLVAPVGIEPTLTRPTLAGSPMRLFGRQRPSVPYGIPTKVGQFLAQLSLGLHNKTGGENPPEIKLFVQII